MEIDEDKIRRYIALIGTRYPKEAVISYGIIVRIWLPVLVDYMNNRYTGYWIRI